MLIHTNGAPCGAGKTRAIGARSMYLADDAKKVIIVQPTKHLIDQTLLTELCKYTGSARIRAIHGGNSASPVADIVKHLRETEEGGEILLITHAAHVRVPWFPGQSRWHLIYDEAPSATWNVEFNLARHHRLITDGFTTEEYNPEYSTVTATPGGYLDRILAHAPKDDVDGLFAEAASHILSPHWAVHVDTEQYHNLLESQGDQGRRKLAFHGLLQPSLMAGYASVLMVGADVEETVLAHTWTAPQFGVTFKEDRSLDRMFRFTEHENGPLLRIKFLTEAGWSKNLRDQVIEGQKVIKHAVDACLGIFGDKPFVYLANNDLQDNIWGKAKDRATRLPNSAHGINSFQEFHNVALLSALNATPAHFGYLESVWGLNGETVKTAMSRATIYQAACRISLRDPASSALKTAIVPDLGTAAWLATKFPGCSVEQADGTKVRVEPTQIGRPRLHESDAMRKKNFRQANRDRLIATVVRLRQEEIEAGRHELATQGGEKGEGGNPISISVSGHTNSAPDGCPKVPGDRTLRTYATLYPDLYAVKSMGEYRCWTFDEFVEHMRDVWAVNTLSKADNLKFIPSMMGDGRGTADVLRSRMIVLDCDGGDLSRHEFARLFRKVRMLIVNSASSTPNTERWRVMIPLNLAVDAELYAEIVARIFKRLQKAGYVGKVDLLEKRYTKTYLDHGLDHAKRNAASLLNIPSPADAGEEASFFEDLKDGRQELDVDEWICRSIAAKPEKIEEAIKVSFPEREAAKAAQVEADLTTWMGEEFDFDWQAQMADQSVPDGFRTYLRGVAVQARLDFDEAVDWDVIRDLVASARKSDWCGQV